MQRTLRLRLCATNANPRRKDYEQLPIDPIELAKDRYELLAKQPELDGFTTLKGRLGR